MYNDVKKKLTEVYKDLKNIKKVLARGGDLYRINFDRSENAINEEDRKAILEDFTTHKSSSDEG